MAAYQSAEDNSREGAPGLVKKVMMVLV